MSECQNLQQQLDDYLSDKVTDFARRRIESHLRQCPPCAEEVNDYREAIEELRAAAREVAVEPSLSLQYSIERLAPSKERHDTANYNHYYSSLILFGVLMFLVTALLTALDHFGKIESSMLISTLTALLGTMSIGYGLIYEIKAKVKSKK
jgi:predicted anti-sigma-YlaC factor YlaD